MEIRRFGPGHRRPDGPPGTQGVTGQVIHSDARGIISELAFGRHAMITPHSNPNTTFFIVISGAGYVQVGQERAPINHGEAVLWPPGETHGAYTDGTEMRAFVVEFAGENDDWARGVVEGRAIAAGGSTRAESATPARGQLAEPIRSPEEQVTRTGEPW
jgi:quercetin dioxygenase-like cupin family protein